MQTVPITTDVVSSNLDHGEVYNIMFVRVFSPDRPVSSTINKTDRHDITEILLKVALNTIKQTNKQTIKRSTSELPLSAWYILFVILFLSYGYCWKTPHLTWNNTRSISQTNKLMGLKFVSGLHKHTQPEIRIIFLAITTAIIIGWLLFYIIFLKYMKHIPYDIMFKKFTFL